MIKTPLIPSDPVRGCNQAQDQAIGPKTCHTEVTFPPCIEKCNVGIQHLKSNLYIYILPVESVSNRGT